MPQNFIFFAATYQKPWMYVAFNMYRLNVFASQKWCTSFFFYISFSLKLKEEFTVLWFMNKRLCKKLMQRWGGIELVFKTVLVHVHVFVICMIFYWYSIVLQNCENFLDSCLACVEWISCTDVDFCQCTYNLAVLVCIWVHCMYVYTLCIMQAFKEQKCTPFCMVLYMLGICLSLWVS